MTTTRSLERVREPARPLAAFLTLILALGLAGTVAAAEDPPKPKDDALESLLKKLGAEPTPPPVKPSDAKKDDVKKDEARPSAPKEATPGPKGEASPAKPGATGKPAGEVAPRDQELDGLLEKLGTTPDKPSVDDKPPGGGPGGPPPADPKPGDKNPDADRDATPKPGTLSGRDRALDEHIAEISGKRKKKKDRREGEDQGPLSDVIKQMRDVEKKLGEAETGEETRKEQTQIVKRLDTLIEQMRSMSQQQQQKKQQGLAMKPGSKPGKNPGEQPGTTGGNAPNARPLRPDGKRSLLAGKDEWGHLPPEMRQEMENVFKEEPLPSREELVRRYYLSVSKKSLNRGE